MFKNVEESMHILRRDTEDIKVTQTKRSVMNMSNIKSVQNGINSRFGTEEGK